VERSSLLSPSKDIKRSRYLWAHGRHRFPTTGSFAEQQTLHALHPQGSRRQIVEYIDPQRTC
jgi:hypothetical protein